MRRRGMIKQNGFTLVELLVSMAVLGMTSAMLMAGLTSVRIVAERSQQQSATGESIFTAQAILRNRLENIVPSTRFDTVKAVADLRGTNDIVSFLAPSAPAQRPDTLSRYRLLRSAPGDIILYAVPDITREVDIYAPGQVGWRPTILLTGTERLALSYFGAYDSEIEARWHDDWIGQKKPPELIRVRIAFKAGDKRTWPDLIVRPVTNINSACEIDTFTGRCE